MKNLLYWAPRVLAICFICFLALFSLDVIGPGYTTWEIIQGMAIHNIPAMILLVSLIIAWKRELVGVVVFILAAIVYSIIVSWEDWFPLAQAMIIAWPPLAIGILFFLSWKNKNKRLK